MPVPEALAVQGTPQSILVQNAEMAETLSRVRYSSRYVLALFFSEAVDLGLGERVAEFLRFDPEKVGEIPPFRFVSACNVKRGQVGPTSVVLHTAVLNLNSEALSPDLMRERLLSQAQNLFPEWPEPEAVECKLWRYSQVS
jgi:predicted NAD/FAD-dependent oxidoreductase